MATFSGSDELPGAQFVDADLRGATVHPERLVRHRHARRVSRRRGYRRRTEG